MAVAQLAAVGRDGTRKAFRIGTHRTVAPEETLARVRRFLPAMGITRVANVTGLDVIGIPVVMVCRPNARSIAVSQGKGLDLAAAKASGVMEAIEGYHAEQVTLPLKLASYEELRYTHRLAPPISLPLVRNSLFRPDFPLLWIEGDDLIGNEAMWLPFELVHVNYTLPPPSGSGCFLASTNGLASGNHRLEAISHAICEVVERDSTALWRRLDGAVQDRTRIDLDSVDDPHCRALLDRFERADIAVGIWDTTSDVGLPSFFCRIMERGDPPRLLARPAAGQGCHPTREIALSRALTEAAQVRATYISGARDDLSRIDYEPADGIALERERRRLTKPTGPLRDFRDLPTRDISCFEEEVDWELARLRAAGLRQAIVVDLTKPELFRIPVVRVVLPGLEGPDEHPGYVPGARARYRAAANR